METTKFTETIENNHVQAPFRVGEWLPSDKKILQEWMNALIEETDKNPKQLLPVIAEFKSFIENDPEVFMYFNLMFSQVPKKYRKDPAGNRQVRDYHHMLQLFNTIMTNAPAFNTTGVVGFPINAILDWSMGTEAGYAAFLSEKVNKQFKKMLNEWGIFLKSADSCAVLNKDPKKGWFGAAAMKAMPNFNTEFICQPELEHHGFTSWDNFFTREFRPGQRPLASPDDNNVITNACESAPYRIAEKVNGRDKFWIKAQPYSVEHMMAGDSFTEKFIGGTIYQLF
jgi:phosphatidylserine decarboxylase